MICKIKTVDEVKSIYFGEHISLPLRVPCPDYLSITALKKLFKNVAEIPFNCEIEIQGIYDNIQEAVPLVKLYAINLTCFKLKNRTLYVVYAILKGDK